MIRDLILDMPTRIRSGVREGLHADEWVQRATEARRLVRKRIYDVREQGERNLFELHVSTLEAADTLLDRAEGVPVLDRVGASARGLLETIEKATVEPPLDDYTSLNVRQVMAQLRDLDHIGLLRVHRFESDNRSRKTILDAIDRELQRRARLTAAA